MVYTLWYRYLSENIDRSTHVGEENINKTYYAVIFTRNAKTLRTRPIRETGCSIQQKYTIYVEIP